MSIDRIQPYFGFTRPPFRADLAPGALHRSGAHCEAKARIAYLVERGALGLVTDEVGSGKTTPIGMGVAVLAGRLRGEAAGVAANDARGAKRRGDRDVIVLGAGGALSRPTRFLIHLRSGCTDERKIDMDVALL